MKHQTLIPLMIAVLMLLAMSIARGNDKYLEVMQKNIQAVYVAQTVETIQPIVNTFERIGDAEKDKWEPFYYAAYGQVMMAIREKDATKKDGFLDQALANVEKARALKPNDSEITALQGFVHMIRVTVDPASRGQQYSGLAYQAFGQAVTFNPENPRALTLMAQMQYGTAQFFGSPTTEACATLAKAFEKFETFKSDNPLAPSWGKHVAEQLKPKCQ